jgi:hypothetical protein
MLSIKYCGGVVSIISTTINSGFALAAPALKPNAEGLLTVTNIIRANCPQGVVGRDEASTTGVAAPAVL